MPIPSLFPPLLRVTHQFPPQPGIYEGHGYWFHGVLQNLGYVYWNVYARNRQMMVDNRKRADESAARRAAKEGKDNKVE